MIHFKLGPKRRVRPENNDPMHRTWVGWDPELEPQTIYEQNRGVWLLGSRADRERLAIFTDTVEHKIRCVVEITAIEQAGLKKRAIVGNVLGPGHPIHDQLVGEEAPDSFRNPVTYPPDPDRSEQCACGCGGRVRGPSQFLSGHDQKAIHSRIAVQWGSTLGFLEWFDRSFGRPDSAT